MDILTLRQSEDLIKVVHEDLKRLVRSKSGRIALALPGGRSASYLVRAILLLDPADLNRLDLFLVDERLEGELNRDTLLSSGLGSAIEQGVFFTSQLHIPAVGCTLSHSQFDRVYLGIGEDGHFASLFPNTWPEQTEEQVILVEESPKPPKRRATLSYAGFARLASECPVYLLFLGASKQDALLRLRGGKEGASTLPCAFFRDQHFNATIVTDLKEGSA
jgi:6-phosphogluconolactonase/glucosamine-6-phosphate isomerase/deaminase